MQTNTVLLSGFNNLSNTVNLLVYPPVVWFSAEIQMSGVSTTGCHGSLCLVPCSEARCSCVFSSGLPWHSV